jgi:transcriptional regulator with XRE-family HTH domain
MGTRIVSFRLEKGYSQTDLAQKTGFSKRMISFYERECEAIPVNKLLKIAEVLGVTIDRLTSDTPVADNHKVKKSFLKKLEVAKTLPDDKQKIVGTLIDSLTDKSR